MKIGVDLFLDKTLPFYYRYGRQRWDIVQLKNKAKKKKNVKILKFKKKK